MIALQSLISLAALFGIMVLYNDYRVDRLRQDLFAVRDRLFDDARQGRIAFTSPGYRAARDMCNGLIRFGHTISLLEFLSFRLMTPSAARERANAAFADFVASLAPDEREVTQQCMLEANERVLEHLVRSPFILLTVFPPLVIVLLTKAGFDLMALAMKSFSGSLQSLDSLALTEGRRSGALCDPATAAA